LTIFEIKVDHMNNEENKNVHGNQSWSAG